MRLGLVLGIGVEGDVVRALAKLAPLLDSEGKKLTWLADITSTSHLPPLSQVLPHQCRQCRCIDVSLRQRQ